MKSTAVVGLACALLAACNSSVQGRQHIDAVVDSGTPAAPKILTTTLPSALEGENYGVALETSGGAPPLTFTVVAQTGASWLGLTPDSGVLFGTAPASSSSGSVTVQLSDALARSAQATFGLSVVACLPGDVRACGETDAGTCSIGEQTCQGGVLTGCEGALPSAEADHCGEGCQSCTLQGGDTCVNGSCVCGDAGTAACSGSASTCCGGGCTDLATDPNNCKACGNSCYDLSRTPGHNLPQQLVATCGEDCGYVCGSPYVDCNRDLDAGVDGDGCEINTSNDALNCGGCSQKCSQSHASESCQASTCHVDSCVAPFRDCNLNASDGCEANTQIDVNHCGGCSPCTPPPNGHVADAGCSSGACGVVACAPGYADCKGGFGDGCETPTTTLTDCGGCGIPCNKPNTSVNQMTCSTGTCAVGSCNAPFKDCDGVASNGCEIDTSNDPINCGSCGNVCPAGGANTFPICTNGVCGVACNSNFGSCDGTMSNGCESSLLGNGDCGSCGRSCGAGTACRLNPDTGAGVCCETGPQAPPCF